MIRQPWRNVNLWCFKSALSYYSPNQTMCVVVIPEVCRRYWWKIASSLIRYNYPFHSISILQTSELDTVHSKHITQRPLLAERDTFFFKSVYLQSMDHMESGEVPPLTLIYLSLGVSEHTLYPGARQHSLSPLWTFKADSGCGGGAGSVCNKTVWSYKSLQEY